MTQIAFIVLLKTHFYFQLPAKHIIMKMITVSQKMRFRIELFAHLGTASDISMISNSFETEGVYSYAYYGIDLSCQPENLIYAFTYGSDQFTNCDYGRLTNCTRDYIFIYYCDDDMCTVNCKFNTSLTQGACEYDGETGYGQTICGPISSSGSVTSSTSSTSTGSSTSSTSSPGSSTTSDAPIRESFSIVVLLLVSLLIL